MQKRDYPAPSVFVRRKRKSGESKPPKGADKQNPGIFEVDLSRPLPVELSPPMESR